MDASSSTRAPGPAAGAVEGSLEPILTALWERTGDRSIQRLLERLDPRTGESLPVDAALYRDWVSTVLMDCFKRTADQRVFDALHALNEGAFLLAVRGRLRRTISAVDARDVVQEVFLNIYRYPHRFQADRADAFRNWGHRIAQNTLLKFLKREARRTSHTVLDEELGDRVDPVTPTPERSASEAESARAVDRAYLLYLSLYLSHFERLNDRERRALELVECLGASYKEAAADLGIRLENLKMVIFRGRRKILRGMTRSLHQLENLSRDHGLHEAVRGVPGRRKRSTPRKRSSPAPSDQGPSSSS